MLTGNSLGVVTNSDISLSVLPLTISLAPESQTVFTAQGVTLTVTAKSFLPLTYQWRFNGSDLGRETNDVLSLTNVQSAQAGLYSVLVSDAAGSVISSNAQLIVIPLTITSCPQNLSVLAGQTAVFVVSAQGTAPFGYQWQYNGADLFDATNATLALTDVQASQAGDYDVTVSNAFGSVTSTNAILSVSEVGAWGGNGSGQLNVPLGLTNVALVAAGLNHSLALNADGTVIAWGDDSSGQANVPPGLANVVAVTGGLNHSLALVADGTLRVWGDNGTGQGVIPPGLSNVVAISVGYSHNLALKADGTVAAWGDNSTGQSTVPSDLTNVVAIAAGWYHSMALKADGSVVAWGINDSGLSSAPPGLSNVVAIAAGAGQSVALKADGTVTVWGQNALGQTNIPAGLTNVVAIAAGWAQSLALLGNGTVIAWGDDSAGQTNVPPGTMEVVSIASGMVHNLVLAGNIPPFSCTPALNATSPVGTSIRLEAVAAGSRPLNYQWQFNGTNLSGATNTLLELTNLQPSQTGLYSVAVSNAFGTLISSGSLLTVSPLAVEVVPENEVILNGQTARFGVALEGQSPFTYQWEFDGADLPGATNDSLNLEDAQLIQAGAYSVAVSNAFGEVTSLAADLALVLVAAWGDDTYGQTNVPPGLSNVVAIAAGVSIIAWH